MSDLSTALDQLAAGFRRLKGIGDTAFGDCAEIQFDEWDWEVGVGLYGMLRDALYREDTKTIEALSRW
mgnify:CR=1 FL=1